MARIYIGLGTNIDRERNLRAGIRALRERFGDLALSAVYETRAVGFEGDNFYNMVIGADTGMAPREVFETLRAIEHAYGRRRDQPRFSSRTLDLDLLLYDDLVSKEAEFEIPRDDIDIYPFVLKPLAELDGGRRHPVKGETFARLWDAFDQTGLDMRPVLIRLDVDPT